MVGRMGIQESECCHSYLASRPWAGYELFWASLPSSVKMRRIMLSTSYGYSTTSRWESQTSERSEYAMACMGTSFMVSYPQSITGDSASS